MSAYYADGGVTLHLGDALQVATGLPTGSVDCIVTSPPYYGLRDYQARGQYGQEETLAAFVETLVLLFSELRRVLSDTGTLWLNLGDTYGKGKQLLGVPWRVALALQADGWVLRNAVVWQKTNAMPESVRDRLRTTYEQVFLFSKSPRYTFNLDAVRLPHAEVTLARAKRGRDTAYAPPGQTPGKRKETTPNALGSNPGDVWPLATKGFKGAHFAVFPPELAQRCILAGSHPGATILDPFSGSATTGMVAIDLGRKYVGIDINPTFHDLALNTRFAGRQADYTSTLEELL